MSTIVRITDAMVERAVYELRAYDPEYGDPYEAARCILSAALGFDPLRETDLGAVLDASLQDWADQEGCGAVIAGVIYSPLPLMRV